MSSCRTYLVRTFLVRTFLVALSRPCLLGLQHFISVLSFIKVVNDDDWLCDTFVPTVQKRGAAVLNARKASSAMSAAKAASDHMKSWWHGTPEGEWVSMAVFSDGSHYDAPEGIMFSFPGNKTFRASPKSEVFRLFWSAISSLNF